MPGIHLFRFPSAGAGVAVGMAAVMAVGTVAGIIKITSAGIAKPWTNTPNIEVSALGGQDEDNVPPWKTGSRKLQRDSGLAFLFPSPFPPQS